MIPTFDTCVYQKLRLYTSSGELIGLSYMQDGLVRGEEGGGVGGGLIREITTRECEACIIQPRTRRKSTTT